MSIATPPSPSVELQTVADLVERLGGVALERLQLHPAPGTATETDLIRFNESRRGLCELVEGVLVEKPVGYFESRLAVVLLRILDTYASEHGLGIVVGPDAPTRFACGVVRLPDVSFVRCERLPGGKVPRDPVAALPPDLAVEILSPSNTRAEIDRKLQEYFAAGVRLVWVADPSLRTVHVYSTELDLVTLDEDDVLDGDEIVPGFVLPIREWFSQAEYLPGMIPGPD